MVVMGDDEETRRLALQVALANYADKPCRICGQLITMHELTADRAVFAGSGAAAHTRCWQGLVDVLRQLAVDDQLRRILASGSDGSLSETTVTQAE